jgi:hypothetical protein
MLLFLGTTINSVDVPDNLIPCSRVRASSLSWSCAIFEGGFDKSRKGADANT